MSKAYIEPNYLAVKKEIDNIINIPNYICPLFFKKNTDSPVFLQYVLDLQNSYNDIHLDWLKETFSNYHYLSSLFINYYFTNIDERQKHELLDNSPNKMNVLKQINPYKEFESYFLTLLIYFEDILRESYNVIKKIYSIMEKIREIHIQKTNLYQRVNDTYILNKLKVLAKNDEITTISFTIFDSELLLHSEQGFILLGNNTIRVIEEDTDNINLLFLNFAKCLNNPIKCKIFNTLMFAKKPMDLNTISLILDLDRHESNYNLVEMKKNGLICIAKKKGRIHYYALNKNFISSIMKHLNMITI